MNRLILLRHGESKWNLENRFTGWKDIELSPNGINEAIQSGKLMSLKNILIDVVYSSELKRANDTAEIALKEGDYQHLFKNGNLIVNKNIALNERDYGNLTGLNKKATAEKYGKDQVHIWRRSYEINPPGGESLKDVVDRVGPYYDKIIKNDLYKGKNVLLSAHGNSIRALFLILNFYNQENISQAEIPTGKPYIVEFKDKKIINNYYL
tara:strand:+ start:430 stop:1056 length:627 start_codon:yes stop_codon:yes gene_type:complete